MPISLHTLAIPDSPAAETYSGHRCSILYLVLLPLFAFFTCAYDLFYTIEFNLRPDTCEVKCCTVSSELRTGSSDRQHSHA